MSHALAVAAGSLRNVTEGKFVRLELYYILFYTVWGGFIAHWQWLSIPVREDELCNPRLKSATKQRRHYACIVPPYPSGFVWIAARGAHSDRKAIARGIDIPC